MTIVAPVDGDPIDPQWAQDVTDAVNNLQVTETTLNGAWTSYSGTFTLTASSVNPSLGNSTVTARYRDNGKTTDIDITIVIGSTFTAGTGDYRFSLPVTMRALNQGVGGCYVLDLGTAHKGGISPIGFSTTAIVCALPSGSNLIGHNAPQVWATGDEIRISITVENA